MDKQIVEDRFAEYAGLGYRGASLEGARLIAASNASGSWCNGLPERLIALRVIMQREAFREGHTQKIEQSPGWVAK